jgi:hypothetical protein
LTLPSRRRELAESSGTRGDFELDLEPDAGAAASLRRHSAAAQGICCYADPRELERIVLEPIRFRAANGRAGMAVRHRRLSTLYRRQSGVAPT